MTTLFLCGDVMLGRGIDQIRARHNRPDLHEPSVHDARDYVALAERASGPIPRAVEPAYVWGDALAELDRVAPDVRIINLETAVTSQETHWPDKTIHYRMHPANVDALTAARIDVCALANNHVLDYGPSGLRETVESLRSAGIETAGAGCDLAEARQPAIVALPNGRRVIVFSLGCANSGVFEDWAVTPGRCGVDYLADLSDSSAGRVVSRVEAVAHRGDVIVVSIHWGDNWGYEVPDSFVRFAHRLIDGGVAIVHGHSSHHPRPIEIYHNRLVLYGCGDLLTDYEGITGYEEFRPSLALLYFVTLADDGALAELRMAPFRVHRFQAVATDASDVRWIRDRLAHESLRFGTGIELVDDETRLAARG